MTESKDTYEFKLPDVGEGLADAEIVRWIVSLGEHARRMEPIVEVETAKSVVEIPSPIDGVLIEQGAGEGQVLEVGDVLARIRTIGEGVMAPDAASESAASTAPAQPQTPVLTPGAAHPGRDDVLGTQPVTRTGTRRRIPAAPMVRRLAVDLGVDLAQVPARGPGGRVLADDVRAFASSAGSRATSPSPAAPSEAAGSPHSRGPSPLPVPGRTESLSRTRRQTAGFLAAAWNQVPLITDLRDVEVSRLVQARATLRAQSAEHLTYTTLFAAAAVRALRRHPVFNASIDVEGGTVTYHQHIHLGIAVSVPDGLSVAVLRNADELRLEELAELVASLAATAREGRLGPQDSTGATFTVSSFGKFGGWYGTPLVVPPQVAIAGFGPIKERVIPLDGQPVIRPILPLSVSADHRLIDGAELSIFTSTLEAILSDPILLLAG